MLEVDNIVLNERIVLDLDHMQHELPRHRVLSHFRQVHEVSHTLVSQRLCAVCLNRDDIRVIGHDGLLVQSGLYMR
jgi:hypothetical protein